MGRLSQQRGTLWDIEGLVSVQRWSLWGGCLSRKVHYGRLRDWSLYRGGLCGEVVSVERYTMGH